MEQEAALLEIRELESEYEILGELGRGGMAVVYLARDRQLGRQVAIKVIHAAAGVDEAAVARQLVEARTVAQLQHPNVVAMYAVKRLSTLGLALVMQYIPGRTLELAMREDGRFTPERAEAVLVNVAAALSYAHARGVIHRDIKPDNIFLNDETGRALVSDFGIALSAEDRQQANDVIVGTPAYMSPEQIDGLDLDGRSDVFSLGLIGYEMLAGVRPWVDENIGRDVSAEIRDAAGAGRVTTGRAGSPARRRRAGPGQIARRTLAECWRISRRTDRRRVGAGRAQPGGPFAHAESDRGAFGNRPVSGPAAGGTPLETVQYRRDGLPTPRRGALAHRRGARARRTLTIALPVLLLGGGAAATVAMHPELLARYHLRLPGAVRDSVARVNAEAMAALRDSTARAIAAADGARHAADSAATAAVTNADSAAALRLAAIRDSLTKAAADAKKALAVPVNNAGTPPATRSRAQTADSAITAARRESATAAPPPPPAPEVIHPPSAPTLVAGGSHSCALSNDGSVLCWGSNDRGQLGLRGTARKTAPTRVSADVPFEQVAAGMADACAVARSGAAYCWGDNTYGQLGDSGAGPQPTPTRVSGGHTFRAIATGTTHSCGLTSTGDVWCWGRNLYGELGNGSTQDQAAPVRVEGGARFVALTVGWNHSCALDDVGHAFCWGQNNAGQLGDGTTIVRAAPAAVAGGLLFRAIAAGGSHTCAVTAAGEAYCWGRNTAGQLGTGDGHDHPLPAKINSSLTFTTVAAGGVHSCALVITGEAWCWGRNSYGQLGDGTTTDRSTPVKVLDGLSYSAIHASGAHTCATATGGSMYCWGDNSDGQLGDGSTTDRSEPVPVTGAR